MTFDDVFAGVAVGAVLAVSDGKAAPPESARLRFACWRSHNFTGALLQKLGPAGGARGLVIEAVNAPGLKIAYTVLEGPAHTFELVE